MSLSEDLIALLEGTKRRINDNDRRSALGIADSYVRGSANIEIPAARYDEDGPINRDGLAGSLMEAIGDAEREEARGALREARAHLNAPFANDPRILKWREQRVKRGVL